EVFNSPLQFDKRHEDLLEIKRILNANGYGGITVTDYFGSFTERRVKEFQNDFGLPISGIIDDTTLVKIFTLKNTTKHFQLGDRHPEIITLKINLDRLGFGGILLTDYFGDFTTTRIKQFQRHYGLNVNGKADIVTLAKIDEILDSPFQLGRHHEDLIHIKRKLNKLGYSGISVTSYFGSFTERRVMEFQSENSLPISGIIDEITLNKINSAIVGPLSRKTIVLDAGHGGSDPGAIANGMRESDLVLDISLRTKALLEAQGATVIMTRTRDVYLTLAERAAIGNNSNADIFISVHANAFNGTANGTETFWNNRYAGQNSSKLAHSLQNAVVRKMGTTHRRVAQESFHVIRETRIPSALLEVGFMDHSGDAAKLKQNSYRQRAAEGILDGVLNYFK
ncbi:N-acetylmuramoyl-L-alanine amidase, partial [Bacillus tamaricis]